jgi:putative hydrolase of the HAD superfamily
MELNELINDIQKTDFFKAGIFDIDNTLYLYEPCNEYGKSSLIYAIAHDFDKDIEEVKAAFNQGRKETNERLQGTAHMHSRFLYIMRTFELLNLNAFQQDLPKYHELFWEAYLSKITLQDWVLPLFDLLKEKHIQIGLLTDFTGEIQLRKIAALGLHKYIDAMVTSEEAGVEKPDTKGLHLLLNKLNCKPTEAFYIGDHPVKDRLGEGLGMKTVIV